MIDALYSAIHQNPKAAAWAFGIVNALWFAFVHFNNKRHERDLQQFQHSFDLELERRKAVFALKVSSYERYVRMLDDFGKKYQTQIGERMTPIFSQYFNEILSASESEDKKKEQQAITILSDSIMLLMNQATQEHMQLQAESKTLKLTASDALLKNLEELESSVAESLTSAQEFMKNFPALFLAKDQAEIQKQQMALSEQGKRVQRLSNAMEKQMRADLSAI